MSYQSSPRNVADSRELATFRPLNQAERNAIRKVIARIGLGQWATSHAVKGDQARLHVLIPGQIVEEEFKTEGLDPARYGLWCLDPVMEINLIDDGFEEVPKRDAAGAIVMQMSLRHDQLLMLGLAVLLDAPVPASIDDAELDATLDQALAQDAAQDAAKPDDAELFSQAVVVDPMADAIDKARAANRKLVGADEDLPASGPMTDWDADGQGVVETAPAVSNVPPEIAALLDDGDTLTKDVRRKLTERLNVELAELKNLRGLAGEDLKREAEIEKLLGLFARLGEI